MISSIFWEIFWNIFCEHFFLPRSFQKFLPFAFLPSGSFRPLKKIRKGSSGLNKKRDSQRHDRILLPENGQFSDIWGRWPYFTALHTENLGIKGKNPLEKIQKIKWRRRSPKLRPNNSKKICMYYACWGPIFLGTPRNPDNWRPQALDRQLNNPKWPERGTDLPARGTDGPVSGTDTPGSLVAHDCGAVALHASRYTCRNSFPGF